MAEVVFVFTEPIVADGAEYDAQVCGRRVGNVWEAWIEFEDADGEALRTRRETTQPNRAALLHWARNLSMTYLEGALLRALDPSAEIPAVADRPHFDGPAPSVHTEPVVTRDAVLDPYAVAANGEIALREQLGALGARHLRNIIRAYNLADPGGDLRALTKLELIDMIVATVVTPA